MSTTVLYPNQETYKTVVSAVLAGDTPVLWVINNRVAIQFQPSNRLGQQISIANPSTANGFVGIVVMGGNSGLASAINGSYGFVWSPPPASGQDDIRASNQQDALALDLAAKYGNRNQPNQRSEFNIEIE